MKSKSYVITYVAALVLGVLLLIFHDRDQLYSSLVIAMGVLIAVPSLVLLLTEIFKKRAAELPQFTTARAVTIVASLAALAFGIWMLCSPAFFITAMIYTLGAILVASGIAQIAFVYMAARPGKTNAGWIIVPLLSIIAGVVLIILGPAKVAHAAGLVAGIALVVYAANGFAALGREGKAPKTA